MSADLIPRTILLVCLGNICRSPTMEAVLRYKASAAGLDLHVDSAGTADYHDGSPPDPRSIGHAARRSYDLAHLRARKVKASDFSEFDLILAADESNVANLMRICPKAYRHKIRLFLGNGPLPDPYYGAAPDFEHVLDLVEQRAEELLNGWTTRNGESA